MNPLNRLVRKFFKKSRLSYQLHQTGQPITNLFGEILDDKGIFQQKAAR